MYIVDCKKSKYSLITPVYVLYKSKFVSKMTLSIKFSLGALNFVQTSYGCLECQLLIRQSIPTDWWRDLENMRGERAPGEVWFSVQDYATWFFTLVRHIFNRCTQERTLNLKVYYLPLSCLFATYTFPHNHVLKNF